MDFLVIKTGMIGFSQENGHPFSFSAILNGYDDLELRESGWPGIADYLSNVPRSEFGTLGAVVTHVWTPNLDLSKNISRSCRVPNICKNFNEMLGEVDAVIIARDDWESHLGLAQTFLESDVPVFIDKPLTLGLDELRYFSDFLFAGKLMSTSGLRYAQEFENVEVDLQNLRLVSATVVKNFEKYGIHMLEALTAIDPYFAAPSNIMKVASNPEILKLEYPGEITLLVNCIGESSKTFQLDFFGRNGNKHLKFDDNYYAFRETLKNFFNMVVTGRPSFDPKETLNLMFILMLGKQLTEGSTANLSKLREEFSNASY